jgi:hypothetical protein
VGAGAQSNIFAVGATSSTRQDRSYYKSLYHFNADVELAEYSLPVLSNQQPAAAIHGAASLKQGSTSQKMPSGIINATQLPPIGYEGMDSGDRGQMRQVDEMDEDMNGVDDYGVR